MANYQTLKAAINAVIKANGNKEITGTVLNEVLLAMVNSLGAGYQFAGVATPSTNPGTPDQKVFYIASQAGTYTNFNGAVVSDGIAIFEYNGSWTVETLDLPILEQVQSDWTETDTTKKSYIKHKPNIPPSANVDPTPTEDSPNAVSSGGTYDMIVNTAATLFGDIQDATNINALESADGKIYDDYKAGDIFIITDNNIRKYRVALVAGTADAEHPVTISPVNFYYAINSADAINLSLTLKTVSTEQQSLSTQQKAQARTNIAAVGYDQQSLNSEQQVQAQNNMVGKAYAPAQFSGLGKKVFAKNIQTVGGVQKNVMTQAFFQDGQGNDLENTIFVIQYDYTLGENITIPSGSVLNFDGGSIDSDDSYTLTLNGAKINAGKRKIFGNIIITPEPGLELRTSWFGLNNTEDCSSILINIIKAVSYKSKLVFDTKILLEQSISIPFLVKFTRFVGNPNEWLTRYTIESHGSITFEHCQELLFDEVTFDFKDRTTHDGLILKADNPLGDNDCTIRNCVFLWGKRGLVIYGRGAIVEDSYFIYCNTAVEYAVYYNYTTPESQTITQQPQNYGRGNIVRNNRFHAVASTSIVLSHDTSKQNPNATVVGMVISNNIQDCNAGFIDATGKIRNLLVSNNSIQACDPNYAYTGRAMHFDGEFNGLQIVGNTIANFYPPENSITSSEIALRGIAKNVIIADNVFGGNTNNYIVNILANTENINICNNALMAECFSFTSSTLKYLVCVNGITKNCNVIGNVYNGNIVVNQVLFVKNVTNMRIVFNLGFDAAYADYDPSNPTTKTNLVTETDIINA